MGILWYIYIFVYMYMYMYIYVYIYMLERIWASSRSECPTTKKLNRDDTHGRSRSEAAQFLLRQGRHPGNPDVSENGGTWCLIPRIVSGL